MERLAFGPTDERTKSGDVWRVSEWERERERCMGQSVARVSGLAAATAAAAAASECMTDSATDCSIS